MRPWLVGLIVFAGSYALASLVGVPALCRNPQYAEMLGFVRACARPGGLPASKMALIYFASVGLGLLVAIVVERFSRPAPEKAEKKEEAAAEQNAVAAIEEILPEETAALQAAAISTPEPVQQPVAHPSALQATATPPPVPSSATPVAHPSAATPQVTPAAHPSAVVPPPVAVVPAIEPGKPAPASMIKVTPPAVAPRPAPVIPPVVPPPVAAAPVIPPPIERPVPPPPPEPTPSFHDDAEFLKKIWGLDAMDAETAAEQGGRYVDESVLSALHYGTDPKMHLSKLAQLMLQQDPDLKSPGVRGVVKHIALRLRELGVAPAAR